jgi:hypothetical protein
MKKVYLKCPIGTEQESIDNTVSILNKEYGDNLKVTVMGRKTLQIEYKDMPDSELVTIGAFLGRTISANMGLTAVTAP